jgi:hypothetical protein
MYSNNPGAIHTYLSLGLEANKKPSFVHLRTEDPFIQSSDLQRAKFRFMEGVLYATLMRDRFSPNTAGTVIERQISGDRLTGKALLIMLEFTFQNGDTFDDFFDGFSHDPDIDINSAKRLVLRFSNVGNIVNKGHLLLNA